MFTLFLLFCHTTPNRLKPTWNFIHIKGEVHRFSWVSADIWLFYSPETESCCILLHPARLLFSHRMVKSCSVAEMLNLWCEGHMWSLIGWRVALWSFSNSHWKQPDSQDRGTDVSVLHDGIMSLLTVCAGKEKRMILIHKWVFYNKRV